MKKIRLMLVDDHQIVLDGLRSLIEDMQDLECVATANNGKRALELLKLFEVDVVLLDVDMPVMNGIEATRAIKREHPQMKVISLTQHGERGMVRRLIECGTDGYLLKNIDREQLSEAIRQVMEGKKVFSDEVNTFLKGKTIERNAGGIEVELTEREIEILALIAQGLSSKQIGERLFISPRTVDTHRTNLMNKMDIHNVAGLIRFALKNGYA